MIGGLEGVCRQITLAERCHCLGEECRGVCMCELCVCICNCPTVDKVALLCAKPYCLNCSSLLPSVSPFVVQSYTLMHSQGLNFEAALDKIVCALHNPATALIHCRRHFSGRRQAGVSVLVIVLGYSQNAD